MSSRRNDLSNIELSTIISYRPHAGLWLDKYLVDQTSNDSKRNLVDELSTLSKTPDVYATFYEQWKIWLKTYGAFTRKATVKGRMIVGLGSESVLETSIMLHQTYGIPYIPGSALKGLAASYASQKLGEKWQKEKTEYKVLFGDTDEAGYITFFDALYIPDTGVNKRALHPDIITVHHPNYYQNAQTAPADWDSPTPIPFLSATGSYLIALTASDLQSSLAKEWIEATFNILEKALETMGIGAKTSSGYGRMKVEVPPIDPELQKAMGNIKELERMSNVSVASQINGYYQHWQKLTLQEARELLAQAILRKVHQAGRQKDSADKKWYKELLEFLEKSGKSV